MMRIRPAYFGWTADEQERYGACIPAEDWQALEQVLSTELFGSAVAARKNASDSGERLSPVQQSVWNEAVLPLCGIGEDIFDLNEPLPDANTILDFETVRAFDEAIHAFQESARREEDPDYISAPYLGSLYLNWARLFVDGRFTYATLSMAAAYIFSRLDVASSELLQALIPHTYVPGRNHGKVEGQYTQWDVRLDANGQEAVLEELQARVVAYVKERFEALQDSWDAAGLAGVYFVDESEPPDSNLHVVFTDKETLSTVRFRSFVRDCRARLRPASELKHAVEGELAALTRFVEEQHAAVLRDHDPKIVQFNPRAKVMVMNGALDGLME